MKKREKKEGSVCAFTGHRSLGADFDADKLLSEIQRAIEEGVDTFLCGMAMGFDLLAAELVLMLKTENPALRLVLCIPCAEQTKHYPQSEALRYRSIELVADESILLSENYYKGCMHARNRYMADEADRLIAYCNKPTGGTAYTVNYFRKKKPNATVILV